MKWIVAVVLFLSAGFAQAQQYVHPCETCVQDVDWAHSAANGLVALTGQPLGSIYVGNPKTKEIRGFKVNLVHQVGGPFPWGFTSVAPSQSVRNEYSAYVDALNSAGGVGGLIGVIMPMSSTTSAFDVTEDGAARHQVLKWIENTNNWPACCDKQMFYAKLIIQEGKQLRTGTDFTIRINVNFADGGTMVVNYDSSCQCLKFVEARDSAGNLLATASPDPTPVDYSSYEAPSARNRADYARGINWLQLRGVVVVGSGGLVTVRRGTVIVGGTVTVKPK